jgi:hypothetical protein
MLIHRLCYNIVTTPAKHDTERREFWKLVRRPAAGGGYRCDAPSTTLYRRFIERAEQGGRHPGHGDSEVRDELWEHPSRELSPEMDIGGKIIHVNTDDFATIDYAKIPEQVRSYMDQARG